MHDIVIGLIIHILEFGWCTDLWLQHILYTIKKVLTSLNGYDRIYLLSLETAVKKLTNIDP